MKIAIRKEELNKLRLSMACMAQGDVRYYLKGILLHWEEDNRIRVVGTDGHRLAADIMDFDPEDLAKPEWWTDLEAENGDLIVGFAKKEKMPNRTHYAVLDLPDRDGNGTLTCYAQNMTVLKVISVSAVDGNYPDWRRIIPEGEPREGVLEFGVHPQYLADISDALVGIKYNNIKIKFGEQGARGSFSVSVPGHSGPDTHIVVMPVYL